jgi:uncharacterized LabA/DUF88 family protein
MEISATTAHRDPAQHVKISNVDLEELRKQYVVGDDLGIGTSYGRILVIIDFGNVDYWFEEDTQDADNKAIPEDEKLTIDLQKLSRFTSLLSNHVRFYYGHDPQTDSLRFIEAAKAFFGKKRVFTKPIQKVRHHLNTEEIPTNTRTTFVDADGIYIQLPKCNFDVEMTVDAIRLMDQYDTLALFSSDADFVSLARYLRKNGKKIILFKGGHITSDLRKETDKVINAQNIKRHIVQVRKRKPGTRPGSANR